ncbi:MAG TPA: hypothetical protein VGW38_27360, partial [Chloroflexota bacterium]|nr:hypothetical protein [Chloroflexota bacterium]
GPQRPEQIVSNSKAAAGSTEPRLFSFGVGYDVNTTLLDTLASEFGGVSAYVKPNESLEEVISSFYDKIGSPVLTDLRLSLDGADVYDLFPTQLPDLYAGSQLVVVGRYRHAGTYDVTLTGQHEGRALRFTAPGTDFSAAPVAGQAFLPRLWASRKIGFLLSEIRLHGADQELVSEIVSLATRYGIATPYTSIFVPEPGTPRGTTRPLVPGAVPGVAPGGFSGSGAGSAPLAAQGQAAAADALRQNLAAAPASGASAVQNAEQTRALKDATTVPATSTSALRTIHGKTFVLVNGVWTDLSTGETPPAQEDRLTIEFGTEAYFDLVEDRPDLAPYLSLGSRVLFNTGDLWIEIVETPMVQ